MKKFCLIVLLSVLSGCGFHYDSDLEADVYGYQLEAHTQQDITAQKK